VLIAQIPTIIFGKLKHKQTNCKNFEKEHSNPASFRMEIKNEYNPINIFVILANNIHFQIL
jgi:hypothetical protein